MKINCNSNTYYLPCPHCKVDYDLVQEKRNTKKSDPIRCPNCGCIVAR